MSVIRVHAAVLLLGVASPAGQVACNSSFVFLDAPHHHPTGLAIADIDQDGHNDLVVAFGNDQSLGRLAVLYGRAGAGNHPFPNPPTWRMASVHGFYTEVAVGDLDQDGCFDAVVSRSLGPEREMSEGGIEVYYKRRREATNAEGPACVGLEHVPSFTTPSHQGTGYVNTGNVLGDADGDGDLDLAVAVGTREIGIFPPQTLPPAAPSLIYENRDGRLQAEPLWAEAGTTPFHDFSVALADIDQDGFMDLVLGGEKVRVHWGERRSDGSTLPNPSAPWMSDETEEAIYGLAVGQPRASGSLPLVTSATCFFIQECAARFRSYYPDRSATSQAAAWSSLGTGRGSHVTVVDVTRDGREDVISSRWSTGLAGTPLLVFPGVDAGGFDTSPTEVGEASVKQRITSACLSSNGRETAIEVHVGEGASRPVITLKKAPLERIVAIRRAGAVIEPDQYAWLPHANWVSLRNPPASREEIEIEYEWCRHPDLVVADWGDGTHGVTVYPNAERGASD